MGREGKLHVDHDPEADPAVHRGEGDGDPLALDAHAAVLGRVLGRVGDGADAPGDHQREAEGDGLTLVLMDLTMPRMDGATAFARMRALRPGIPVILSSGYDRQALEGARPAAFVQKPYRFKELRKLMQEVLAG